MKTSPHPKDIARQKEASLGKTPVLLKVFGGLTTVVSLGTLAIMIMVGLALNNYLQEAGISLRTMDSIVLFGLLITCLFAGAIVAAVFGIRLLINKRRGAALAADALIAIIVVALLCDIMLFGIDIGLLYISLVLLFLIVLQSFIDPTLSEERALQRKLRNMETRDQAEAGTLGRDETGKGFISLNFFNLFWIFVVASFIGLILEVIFHMTVVDPGVYQDRAGMLYGPFSPIYGFGAVLITLALNRFYKKPLPIIFLVSAVIGGAFEFAVSWFLQYAFGVVAWDYTGTFLSIDGRTNGMFMTMWGILGIFWIRLILPHMLKLINKIPWNWRYSVTTVCAALMIANGVMTLASLDCWYERNADQEPNDALELFCAKHYDDEFMEHRFQSMTMNPENATRAE